MAKFDGLIGYVISEQTAPGVWTNVPTERRYMGDIIRDTRRWETGKNLNENLNVNNQFSIVADAFAYENVKVMQYVKWMGVAWKITSFEVQRPRLILSVGGVYNG
jgi:hypothetical protein